MYVIAHNVMDFVHGICFYISINCISMIFYMCYILF